MLSLRMDGEYDSQYTLIAPLLAAAKALGETDDLPARTRSALRDLTQSFTRWSDQATALSHIELADRLNLAFTALREEAQADYETRYGGELR